MTDLKVGELCFGVACSHCGSANGLFQHDSDAEDNLGNPDGVFRLTCAGCQNTNDYSANSIQLVTADYIL